MVVFLCWHGGMPLKVTQIVTVTKSTVVMADWFSAEVTSLGVILRMVDKCDCGYIQWQETFLSGILVRANLWYIVIKLVNL